MEIFLKTIVLLTLIWSCKEGEIQEIGTSETQDFVSGSVATSTGSGTTSGNVVTVLPDIVEVSFIVEAEDWDSTDPDYNASLMPFSSSPTRRTSILGDNFTGSFEDDTQYPAQFKFSYPANNFQLSTAHLIIDTAKIILTRRVFGSIKPSLEYHHLGIAVATPLTCGLKLDKLMLREALFIIIIMWKMVFTIM